MKVKYHSGVDVVNKISGKADGAGQKHAVFVSRWNDFITERLQDGAISTLERHGVRDSDITVVYVPGAFELASAAKLAAESKKYDAVICLGAVIRGATPHFDYVAGQAARLIAQISYDTGIPAVFGVLTTDTIEQAIERAGTKAGNKGVEAALTAIELANLYKELKGKD